MKRIPTSCVPGPGRRSSWWIDGDDAGERGRPGRAGAEDRPFPADEHRRRQHDRGRHLHDVRAPDARPRRPARHARALGRRRRSSPSAARSPTGSSARPSPGRAGSTPSSRSCTILCSDSSPDGPPSSSASRRPSPPRPSASPNISRGPSPGFPTAEALRPEGPGLPRHPPVHADPRPGDRARSAGPERPDGRQGRPDRGAHRGRARLGERPLVPLRAGGRLPVRFRGPEERRPGPDVDHVRLQRLERLGLYRIRGPASRRGPCPGP